MTPTTTAGRALLADMVDRGVPAGVVNIAVQATEEQAAAAALERVRASVDDALSFAKSRGNVILLQHVYAILDAEGRTP